MIESAPLGRRREALRTAVLAATLDEVVEVGFDRASMKAIAKRAGVHETSLYRRWVTREALLMDALLEKSAGSISVPNTGRLRGDLLSIAEAVSAMISTPLGRALLHAGVRTTAATAEQRQAFWLARWSELAIVVERAKERGEIRADVNGRLLLEALTAPLHMRVLLAGGEIPHELPGEIVELLLESATR